MKKLFSAFLLFSGVIMTSTFSSCSKDDDPATTAPTVTKKITLYNTSSGSPVEAGSITFAQLADSSASATININSGYRSGSSMPANISTVINGTALIYANLAAVDGNTGTSTTSPVLPAAGTNQPVKYTTLIGLTGYIIRVTSGSNVQAQGTL